MGIFPIWGFQMLTAIGISIFFRLNKVLVILAANISIPPLIPIVLYLSHFTGAIWMGDNAQYISFSKGLTLDTMHNYFVQYVIGAITLALVAGLVFGLLSYGILKLQKRSKT
jgi:uncharacterized protein (DUF2062 family)